MIKAEDRCEFIGQIMDVIEDVLDEKGIKFDNTYQLMKDAGCSDEEIKDNPVILYGENYDDFADPITQVMYRWNVLEEN